MKRRDIFRFLGRSLALAPFVNSASLIRAYATEPIISLGDVQSLRRDDTIIVIIRLFGGNDGLNTVIPFTDPWYYKHRRDNGGANLSIPAESVLTLGNHPTLGLHPNLQNLKTLYDENKVAVVQNVGYPDQDLSHFRSTDIWLSASDAHVRDETGWVGRYVEYLQRRGDKLRTQNPFAVEIATSRTRLTRATIEDYTVAFKYPVPVPNRDDHNRGKQSGSSIEQEYIRSILNISNGFLGTFAQAELKAGKNLIAYPEYNELATDLARTMRLIAGGADARLYAITTTMMFDNHESLMRLHPIGLSAIDGPIYAFQRELELRGLDKRVVILVHSEFGRKVTVTKDGTDHGAAAPVLVIGSQVNGGVYGTDPDLEHLDSFNNLRHSIDFRSIYCSLLEQWYDEPVHLLSPAIFPHRLETLPLIKLPDNDTSLPLRCNPNPAIQNTYIECNIEHVTECAVFNMNGRKQDVITHPSGLRALRLDCSTLPSGMYFVCVTEASIRRIGRVVVSR